MNKQDMPKAVVLAVLVFALFGFVGWRLLNTGRPSQSTRVASNTTPSPVNLLLPQNQGAQGTEATDEQLAQIDAAQSIVPASVPGFSPFRRTVATIATGRPSATGTRPPGGSRPGPIEGEFGSLDPLKPTAPMDPMVSMTLELQGLILGKPSYAIIKIGERVTYVRLGEMLSEHVKLVALDGDSAVLRYNGQNYRLIIGSPRQLVTSDISVLPSASSLELPAPKPNRGLADEIPTG